MKKVLSILSHDIWFHIFASLSLILIVASFIIPPTGVIDPSVIGAVGEIAGFGALWELHIAIRKGFDAKISHHDTSIEINKD